MKLVKQRKFSLLEVKHPPIEGVQHNTVLTLFYTSTKQQ